jgi:hypothetical protein
VAWRYFATRLRGDGTEDFLMPDLPLSGAEISKVLTGTNSINATITPEVARLQTSTGDPLFVPWSTCVYAEVDGVIDGAGIVTDLTMNGPNLELSCAGFTGYLKDRPFLGDYGSGAGEGVGVDPLDMLRMIWAHVQGHPRGNLGLVIDQAKSGIRIGQPPGTTSDGGEDFETGPYNLAWYKTSDLEAEAVRLARAAPFDWVEEHAWSGDTISHRLRLGHQRIGRRRLDMRWTVGENVTVVPQIEWDGEEYADEVLVLGSGEGRKMIAATALRSAETRLSRVVVYPDKAATSTGRAQATAARQVALRAGTDDVTQVVVRRDAVPSLGDEVRLLGAGTGWGGDLDLWVRVLATSRRPDESDDVTCTVIRADKEAA